MRPLEILMLGVDGLMVVVVAAAILMRRPNAERPRGPVWTGLSLPLLLVAMVSWNIADKHDGDLGSELLHYASPLLLGMGISMALMAIRERRGLDKPG